MADSISNSEDLIDSRDVIKRIEELESERESLSDALGEAEGEDITTASSALGEWDEENREEFRSLQSLQEQTAGYCGDWRHGATLIRDSYFKEYAQNLAEEIGAIQSDAVWPHTCIDWEQAANELQADYTSVEFGDVTYWIR